MAESSSLGSLTGLRRGLVCAILAYTLSVLIVSGTGRIVAASVGLCGIALMAVRLAGRLEPSVRVRRLGRGADIVTTNLALALVLMEVSLQAYGAMFGSILLVRDSLDSYRFLPNHDYGRLWTNASGYASREFARERRPGITRIALLGDSFAVGAVRQDVNFASWIERLRPHTEVYNFGISAIGPEEYNLILRTEALALNPDIVLVALFVGNDLTQPPTPADLNLEDHALGRFAKRGWRLLRERFRLRTTASHPPIIGPQLRPPPVPEKGFNLSRQTYLEVELERLTLSRTSRQPFLDAGWTRSLAHLRAMRDECRQRNIAFRVAIIPDEYQVNPDLLDELLSRGSVPRSDIVLDLPQRRLLDFCRTEGIACLDLLPRLAGSRDTYLPQDTHWNEKGNLVGARAIAAWLDSLGDPGLAPPN